MPRAGASCIRENLPEQGRGIFATPTTWLKVLRGWGRQFWFLPRQAGDLGASAARQTDKRRAKPLSEAPLLLSDRDFMKLGGSRRFFGQGLYRQGILRKPSRGFGADL